MALKDWSTTPSENDSVPPDGAPEGMVAGSLNNTVRQIMADVRVYAEDGGWFDFSHDPAYASATVFTVNDGTDLTDIYLVNRRVRAVGSATGTIYGTISTSSFLDPATQVTVVWDSGSLQNEVLAISLGQQLGSFASGIVTFHQASEPTATNIGDIWYDTDDGFRTYRWDGATWDDVQDLDISQAITDAAAAQSTADGKVTTFYQDAQPSAEGVGDLWVDTNDGNTAYRWSGSTWDVITDADIATALADAATAQSTADGKIVSFYQTGAPTAEGVGDIWVDTDDADRPYRWNGSSWVDITWLEDITAGQVDTGGIVDAAATTPKIENNAVTNQAFAYTAGTVTVTSDGADDGAAMAVTDADMTTIAEIALTPAEAPTDGGGVAINATINLDTFSFNFVGEWGATVHIARKLASTWSSLQSWSGYEGLRYLTFVTSFNNKPLLGNYNFSFVDTTYSASNAYTYAIRIGSSTDDVLDTLTFSKRYISVTEAKR